jgi:Tyosinase C-terminal domain
MADSITTDPSTYRDWVANVTIEKHALGGSGKVYFFIGDEKDIPPIPSQWHQSPLYVGAFSILGIGQGTPEMTIGGTVHLTKALIRHGVPLTGRQPVEYLTKNLHWRVSTVTGEEKSIADIPSLKIVVQSAGYEVPGGVIGGRPERTGWTRYPEITHGKPGGVDHKDDF